MSEACRTRYGATTLALLERLQRRPARPSSLVLLRHAARHYGTAENDLDEPLSDEGRAQARDFGAAIPSWRRFATLSSPAERCVETAELIEAGHGHPQAAAHRIGEELGVFYVRDMRKVGGMLKHLGTEETLRRWFAGEVPPEVMMPADEACAWLLERLRASLAEAGPQQLTLGVTHDWNLYLLRHQAMGLRHGAHPPITYLEGFGFWLEEPGLMAAPRPGEERQL